MLRAQLYNILCQHISFDLEIYRRYLREDAKLLELGIGTGRSLIPLIDHTSVCVGIDNDPDMITFCKTQPEMSRVHLYQQDISHFSVPFHFTHIHLPLRIIQLLEAPDRHSCIQHCCQHLETGGRIIIHVSLWKPDQHTGHWRFFQARPTDDGGKMIIEECALARQNTLELCYKMQHVLPNQHVQSSYVMHRILHRCSMDELTTLLEAQGLHISILPHSGLDTEFFIMGEKK